MAAARPQAVAGREMLICLIAPPLSPARYKTLKTAEVGTRPGHTPDGFLHVVCATGRSPGSRVKVLADFADRAFPCRSTVAIAIVRLAYRCGGSAGLSCASSVPASRFIPGKRSRDTRTRESLVGMPCVGNATSLKAGGLVHGFCHQDCASLRSKAGYSKIFIDPG